MPTPGTNFRVEALAEKYEDALPHARAAWSVYETGVGQADNRAESASALAEALAGTGDPRAARPLAERSIALFREDGDTKSADAVRTWLDELPPAD